MAKLLGVALADEMLQAMGINLKEVKGFTLRVYANEVITIKIERYATQDELSGLLGWLRRKFGYTTVTEIVAPVTGEQ